MKNILFPHVFQLIGWIMFVPSLIAGALILTDHLSISTTVILDIVINDIVIIGIVLGALFIVCSKEKIEDEMTQSIRLTSLLTSIYVYVALFIICTLAINDFSYLLFAVINLVLFPIIFMFIFRIDMYRYRKMFKNEEQD